MRTEVQLFHNCTLPQSFSCRSHPIFYFPKGTRHFQILCSPLHCHTFRFFLHQEGLLAHLIPARTFLIFLSSAIFPLKTCRPDFFSFNICSIRYKTCLGTNYMMIQYPVFIFFCSYWTLKNYMFNLFFENLMQTWIQYILILQTLLFSVLPDIVEIRNQMKNCLQSLWPSRGLPVSMTWRTVGRDTKKISLIKRR